jgi:hypothetical protein
MWLEQSEPPRFKQLPSLRRAVGKDLYGAQADAIWWEFNLGSACILRRCEVSVCDQGAEIAFRALAKSVSGPNLGHCVCM